MLMAHKDVQGMEEMELLRQFAQEVVRPSLASPSLPRPPPLPRERTCVPSAARGGIRRAPDDSRA